MKAFHDQRGMLYVLPLLTGVVLFTVVPGVMAVYLSFCRWSFTTSPEFIGLWNYRKLLGLGGTAPDPLFVQALVNTLIIASMVPLQVAGSFLLAVFLQHRNPWGQFLRLIVFLPTLVSPVALFILWRWIFNADFGLISLALGKAGLAGPAWLEDPTWSKPAVMLVLLWESVGSFQMLFFLAALRQIPGQLHEMARLDGLGFFHKARAVYFPWLKKAALFNGCLGLLGALQGGFEITYIMTGGGPVGSTTTLSLYLFQNAFEWERVGYASAVGVAMLALVSPLLLAAGLLRGKRPQ